jgi:hypothetical protein
MEPNTNWQPREAVPLRTCDFIIADVLGMASVRSAGEATPLLASITPAQAVALVAELAARFRDAAPQCPADPESVR